MDIFYYYFLKFIYLFYLSTLPIPQIQTEVKILNKLSINYQTNSFHRAILDL